MDPKEALNRNVKEMKRRNCVWGESFDPEDIDEGEIEVIPKTPEEEARIWKCLKDIFLFKSVSSEDLEKIISVMRKIYFEAGEIVMRQGEEGDYLYVLDSGVFQAVKRYDDGTTMLIQTYENADHFGELALMYDVPWTVTVSARTAGVLWALDRYTFRKMVVGGAYRKQKLYKRLITEVPVLQGLSQEEKTRLVDALMEVSYPDGEKLVGEGDIADSMFFVISGEVRITKERCGTEVEVERLHNGDYFGEQDLLKWPCDSSRSCSAYSIGKVQLAILEFGAFHRLMGTSWLDPDQLP